MNEKSRLDIKDSLTHQSLISQPSYALYLPVCFEVWQRLRAAWFRAAPNFQHFVTF